MSDGETITVVEGHGPRHAGVRRAPPRAARRPSRDRPQAVLHHRLEHAGATRSRCTARWVTPASRSATTATSPTPSSSPSSSGCCPGMMRESLDELDSTTDSALVAELIAAEFDARSRAPTAATSRSRSRRCCPGSPAASRSCSWTTRTSSACATRTGSGPSSSGARPTAGGCSRARRAALDIVGAHFVREIEPGEMIVIDATGMHTKRFAEPEPKLCLFEFVYFARPDTNLYGRSVHAARQRMGEELARQAPVDADMVMPVPESGIPAAQGYARDARASPTATAW